MVLSVVDVFMLCSPVRLMASSSSFSVVVVVVVALSPCTSRGPARLIGCVLPHVSAPEFASSLFSSETKKKEKKGGCGGEPPTLKLSATPVQFFTTSVQFLMGDFIFFSHLV